MAFPALATYKGVFYTLLCSIFVPVSGIFTKWTSRDYGFQIGAFLCSWQLLVYLPWVAFQHQQNNSFSRGFYDFLPRPESRQLSVMLTFRGLLGPIGCACLISAYQYLPVGDVTTISYCSGMISTLLSGLFMGEVISKSGKVMLLLSLMGVILVAKPLVLLCLLRGTCEEMFAAPKSDMDGDGGPVGSAFDVKSTMYGLSYAFGSTIFWGISAVLCKFVCSSGEKSVLIDYLYYAIGGTITLWPLTLYANEMAVTFPDFSDLSAILLVGIFSTLAQVTMTEALRSDKTYIYTIFNSTQILFAFLIDFVFYGRSPDWSSLAGAALIVFSSVFESLKKACTKK